MVNSKRHNDILLIASLRPLFDAIMLGIVVCELGYKSVSIIESAPVYVGKKGVILWSCIVKKGYSWIIM